MKETWMFLPSILWWFIMETALSASLSDPNLIIPTPLSFISAYLISPAWLNLFSSVCQVQSMARFLTMMESLLLTPVLPPSNTPPLWLEFTKPPPLLLDCPPIPLLLILLLFPMPLLSIPSPHLSKDPLLSLTFSCSILLIMLDPRLLPPLLLLFILIPLLSI